MFSALGMLASNIDPLQLSVKLSGCTMSTVRTPVEKIITRTQYSDERKEQPNSFAHLGTPYGYGLPLLFKI
jgi:hypothetical protein